MGAILNYMKETILELDYEKMVKAIDDLVQTDFCFDMNCKLLSNSKPYTQKEAEEMASLLGTIYSISHQQHCKACRDIKFAKTHILPNK